MHNEIIEFIVQQRVAAYGIIILHNSNVYSIPRYTPPRASGIRLDGRLARGPAARRAVWAPRRNGTDRLNEMSVQSSGCQSAFSKREWNSHMHARRRVRRCSAETMTNGRTDTNPYVFDIDKRARSTPGRSDETRIRYVGRPSQTHHRRFTAVTAVLPTRSLFTVSTVEFAGPFLFAVMTTSSKTHGRMTALEHFESLGSRRSIELYRNPQCLAADETLYNLNHLCTVNDRWSFSIDLLHCIQFKYHSFVL